MAGRKRIDIDIGFNTDTSRAKAQIQDLQKQIVNLSVAAKQNTATNTLSSDISKAVIEASKLNGILSQSMTFKGDNLDLSKFVTNLNKSGTTISQVRKNLESLGPQGQKAFTSLAQSIMSAEVPLRQSEGLLKSFSTTLTNSAKWTVASGAVHQVQTEFSKAFEYSRKLDKSLNEIRIVSGESSDNMAKFAKQANESAKALNTTTTAYTNAALIFYQQGLDTAAVKERTDAVTKMASVTGETAADVSSYMTAIWNNFNDGSKSVEYFADVLTALGAATASSTDEIAEGLEKFASIGNTVGLSYEYATSALATVVAETRQSADTVGTAFKTLFARIQDLELGNTLDDGTTLGQYSKALEAIGVNIKDSKGEIRDMDDILDDMGSKWKTISKDTQIAVAQAVAGTRQYSQLIALMDKWDVFQENLNTAKGAEGSLQQQADIYAESWDAASKKIKTSLEEIYSNLIDSKTMVDLMKFLSKAIEGFGHFIDSVGGVRTAFILLANTIISNQGPQISKYVDKVVDNFKIKFGIMGKEIEATREKAQKEYKAMIAGMDIKTPEDRAQVANMKANYDIENAIFEKKKELAKINANLTESQIEQIANEKAQLKQLEEESEVTARIYDTKKKARHAAHDDVLSLGSRFKNTNLSLDKVENIKIRNDILSKFLPEDTLQEAYAKKVLLGEMDEMESEKYLQENYSKNERVRQRNQNFRDMVKQVDPNKKFSKQERRPSRTTKIEDYNSYAQVLEDTRKALESQDYQEPIQKILQKQFTKDYNAAIQAYETNETNISTSNKVLNLFDMEKVKSGKFSLKGMQETLSTLYNSSKENKRMIDDLMRLDEYKEKDDIKKLITGQDVEGINKSDYTHMLQTIEKKRAGYLTKRDDISGNIRGLLQDYGFGAPDVAKMSDALDKQHKIIEDTDESLTAHVKVLLDVQNHSNSVVDSINKMGFSVGSIGENFTNGANAMSNFAMTANSVYSVFESIEEMISGDLKVSMGSLIGLFTQAGFAISGLIQTGKAFSQFSNMLSGTIGNRVTLKDQQALENRRYNLVEARNNIDTSFKEYLSKKSRLKDDEDKQKRLSNFTSLLNEDGIELPDNLSAMSKDERRAWLGQISGHSITKNNTTSQHSSIYGLTGELMSDEGWANFTESLKQRRAAAQEEQDIIATTQAVEGRGVQIASKVSKAMGAIGIAVQVATAAYAAYNLIHKAVVANLQKEAEESLRVAQNTTEKTKQYKEESDKVSELKKAYDELYNKYNDGELSASALKRQSYDLCMQYGEEELAVKALSGEYKSLEEAMKSIESEKTEKTLNSAKQEQKNYEVALRDQLSASAEEDSSRRDFVNSIETIDLKGMVTRNAKEDNLANQLQKLGVEFINKDHINLQSFVAAIKTDTDAVQSVLNESDTSAARQLRQYLSSAKDQVDGLTESIDTAHEAQKTMIIDAQNFDAIDSIEDYTATWRSMVHEALSKGVYDSIEDASKWANSYMSAIDSVKEYAQTATVADTLAGNTSEEVLKEVLEQKKNIDNFTAEDYVNELGDKAQYKYRTIGVLQGGVGGGTPNEADSYVTDANLGKKEIDQDAVAEWRENKKRNYGLSNSLDYYTSMTQALDKYSAYEQSFFTNFSQKLSEAIEKNDGNVETALSSLAEKIPNVFKEAAEKGEADYAQTLIDGLITDKTELTDKQKKQVLNTLDFSGVTSEGVSVDEKTLNNMDYSSQATLMAAFYGEKLKLIEETGDAAREEAQKEAETYKETYKDQIDDYKEAQKELELLSEDSDANFTQESINKLADEFNGDNLNDLKNKDAFTELTKVMQKQGYKTDDNTMKQFFEGLSNKKYADQLEKLDNLVKDLTVDSEDWNKVVKAGKKAQEANSSVIDDIQAGYKTLTSAMKDYNANGYFTMDNLQAILELEPKYLSALEWDGSQFKLNTADLKEMTKAKLADMAVSQAEITVAKVKSILSSDNIVNAAMELEMTQKLTTSTMSYAESLIASARGLATNNKELQNNAAAMQQVMMYIDAQENAIAAIGNVYDNIDAHFDKIMGGSSAASSSKKKYFEDEFDRYWEFKKAIDEVAHAMERLEDEQDNLYGQELIDNLNQVNDLLVTQKANYEALYEAQKVEAEELRSSLSAYGALFDEEGRLTNYADITTSMFAQYGNVDDSETYEEFKKYLERYDTLYYSEMVDTTDKIVEESKKILENNLKIWETDIQINLDLKQAERDWNDFLKEINRNFKSTFSDAGQEIKYALKKAQTFNLDDGTLASDIQKVENINYEINQLQNGGTSNLFNSLSEAENALKEANKTLQDDAEELFSTYEEGWNAYLDYIDDVGTHLDNINKKYEELNEELEHQANLISLLYGDQAYDKLAKLYDTQQKNNLAQLKSLRQQTDFYQAQYEKAVQLDGEDSKSAEKWLEKKRQAMQDLRSEEETYIKTIQSKYNNTIDSIIQKARMATNGGVDTDWARTMYELTKTKSEGNYDDVERVYQLTSLQSKWNKLIADTTGTKNQEKLKKIMDEQLANLEKKSTLTEYDIGLAEKALAVEQARIALEQAQNSKDSMKLTRNAEGNWSYQYVADEDNVAEKQQDLLDAINDKYEYVKSANQQALDDLLQYEEDFWTKYAEIMKDVSLSDEERQSRIAQLYEMYYGEEGILTQAYQDSAQTQQDLNLVTAEQLWAIYESDQEKYATMTAAEQELIDGLKNGTIKSYEDIQEAGQRVNDESLDYWNTTAQAMADAWNADDGMSIKSQVNEALKDCSTALGDYNADVDAGCAAAGEDFTDVGNAIDDVSNAIDDLDGTTEDYIDNAEKLIDDYINSLKELESQWKEVKSIVEKNIETMKKYELAAKSASTAYSPAAATPSSGGSGGGDATDIADNNPPEETVHYYAVDSAPDGDGLVVTVYERTGNSEKAIGRDGEEPKDYRDHRISSVWEARDYINQVLSDNGYDEELDPNVNVQTSGYKYYLDNARVNTYSFDTGGYTGEWDNSGRLAILHQKELVLNKDDTENILNAVEFVRGIANSIGASLLSQLAGMTNATSSIRPVGADYLSSNVSNASSSNVYNVTAEFPNAESVQDIREALLSLPNLVSQKVNEKNI
jgi:TP901 family phage tail tape measure protein